MKEGDISYCRREKEKERQMPQAPDEANDDTRSRSAYFRLQSGLSVAAPPKFFGHRTTGEDGNEVDQRKHRK
jgi:hypothetical protein